MISLYSVRRIDCFGIGCELYWKDKVNLIVQYLLKKASRPIYCTKKQEESPGNRAGFSLYTILMVYKIPHHCDCEYVWNTVILHYKNKQTQKQYYHGKNCKRSNRIDREYPSR